jgi:hypothetical protein
MFFNQIEIFRNSQQVFRKVCKKLDFYQNSILKYFFSKSVLSNHAVCKIELSSMTKIQNGENKNKTIAHLSQNRTEHTYISAAIVRMYDKL